MFQQCGTFSLHFIDSILIRNVKNKFYQVTVVVVIVWQLQSVPITTKVVSPNPACGELYSIM